MIGEVFSSNISDKRRARDMNMSEYIRFAFHNCRNFNCKSIGVFGNSRNNQCCQLNVLLIFNVKVAEKGKLLRLR